MIYHIINIKGHNRKQFKPNLKLHTTLITLILMFQFIEAVIKWISQAPTQYIQYHLSMAI